MTTNDLVFWRLVHEMDQKVSTIAATLADKINGLRGRGFAVCSMVTDNPSNEVTALNRDLAISVQKRTGVMVFSPPCLSHTTNLTGALLLKWLASNPVDLCDVWVDMITFRDPMPFSTREAQFHELPSLCRTRWLSMGEFVEAIALRYPEVHASIERDGGRGQINALERCNFQALVTCLPAFNEFTLWSEEVQTNLGSAWGRIIELVDRFSRIRRNGLIFAAECASALVKQIFLTEGLTQLLLGLWSPATA